MDPSSSLSCTRRLRAPLAAAMALASAAAAAAAAGSVPAAVVLVSATGAGEVIYCLSCSEIVAEA